MIFQDRIANEMIRYWFVLLCSCRSALRLHWRIRKKSNQFCRKKEPINDECKKCCERRRERNWNRRLNPFMTRNECSRMTRIVWEQETWQFSAESKERVHVNTTFSMQSQNMTENSGTSLTLGVSQNDQRSWRSPVWEVKELEASTLTEWLDKNWGKVSHTSD